MIQSFGNKLAKDIFSGNTSKETRSFSEAIVASVRRRLDQLNRVKTLHELGVPPGNHLEALKGNLKGYHSIRINAQWRIIFKWTEKGPEHVEVTDYH